MDCLLLLVLFFGFLFVVAGGIGIGLAPHTSSRAFSSLAQRFDGSFQRGGLFRWPSARFLHGQAWVLVTQSASRGRTGATQVMVQWPDAKCRFHLETPPRSSQLANPSQPHPWRLVPSDGGQPLCVRGDDNADVDRLLSDGVRWQIASLQQCVNHRPVHMTIRRGRLLVETPVIMRRALELEEFTRQVLGLFDQLLLTRGEGIEFLGDPQQAQPMGELTCPVCCGTITTDLVFCRRCGTPHHLECWQYNSGCSTYACRETRYALPRVARPISRRSHPERGNRQ